MRVALAVAAFALSAAAQTAPRPTAEAILDRFVEASGGKAAYAKLHTMIVSGAVNMESQGISGTLTTYASDKDEQYSTIELNGIGKVESGVSGGVAWEMSPLQGTRIRQGEEGAGAVRQAVFNAGARWRDIYKTVELLPAEATCDPVRMTPKQGAEPVLNCFDRQTGLLQRTRMTISSPMGPIPVEVEARDWRAVEGVLIAHKSTRLARGQRIVTQLQKVTVNEPIPPARFALPEAIRALQPKGGR